MGAERAVVVFDPSLVDADLLTDAVAQATGFKARRRTEPGSDHTEDAEAQARREEVATSPAASPSGRC